MERKHPRGRLVRTLLDKRVRDRWKDLLRLSSFASSKISKSMIMLLVGCGWRERSKSEDERYGFAHHLDKRILPVGCCSEGLQRSCSDPMVPCDLCSFALFALFRALDPKLILTSAVEVNTTPTTNIRQAYRGIDSNGRHQNPKALPSALRRSDHQPRRG